MWADLQMLHHNQTINDPCALYGKCLDASRIPHSNPIGSDPVSVASHSSLRGVYTAAQVEAYRRCAADYTSTFVETWDGTTTPEGRWNQGLAPKDGNVAKVESFRMCWEPIHA